MDASENTLPFVSQSTNSFSNYDISQSVDWECPSLSPHVLLISHNHTGHQTVFFYIRNINLFQEKMSD